MAKKRPDWCFSCEKVTEHKNLIPGTWRYRYCVECNTEKR